jgi:hypothetical protein
MNSIAVIGSLRNVEVKKVGNSGANILWESAKKSELSILRVPMKPRHRRWTSVEVGSTVVVRHEPCPLDKLGYPLALPTEQQEE